MIIHDENITGTSRYSFFRYMNFKVYKVFVRIKQERLYLEYIHVYRRTNLSQIFIFQKTLGLLNETHGIILLMIIIIKDDKITN